MLAPREVDEYVLPTERRVIRFRRHWAVIVSEVLQALPMEFAMEAQKLVAISLEGSVG